MDKIKKLKFFFLILCILQLFYIFQFRSNFQYEIIKNPFKEESGIFYALSPDVIETKTILLKKELTDFNLSQKLKENTYFYQRSVEFNYPIRLKDNSKKIFFSLEEQIPDNCNILETGKYLKLVGC